MSGTECGGDIMCVGEGAGVGVIVEVGRGGEGVEELLVMDGDDGTG